MSLKKAYHIHTCSRKYLLGRKSSVLLILIKCHVNMRINKWATFYKRLDFFAIQPWQQDCILMSRNWSCGRLVQATRSPRNNCVCSAMEEGKCKAGFPHNRYCSKTGLQETSEFIHFNLTVSPGKKLNIGIPQVKVKSKTRCRCKAAVLLIIREFPCKLFVGHPSSSMVMLQRYINCHNYCYYLLT